MKDVSIVIVNYRMKEDIEKCLRSLYRDLIGSRLSVQVVVVDNNSGDDIGTCIKEKYPEIYFIPLKENSGFGKANNIGMEAVKATYYFALNPDTIFLEGQRTVDRLYECMESRPAVGLMGPKVVYPDGSLQYSCWRFPTFWQPLYSRSRFGKSGRGKKYLHSFLMKDFDHERTTPVDAIMGSAMFIRHTARADVGGFDERYWMYFEDIDWSRRMWEAGWPVYYVHDIVLQHAHGRGSAKVPGVVRPLVKNRLARVHFMSWLKYMWKWRGNNRHYRRT